MADVFNSLHLFNPNWPPHARLHNAMQAVMLVIVAAASASALWRKPRSRFSIAIAALAPMAFFAGLVIAPLAPGTSLYASEELRSFGFPINLALAIFWLALTATGWLLAARDLPPEPARAARN